MASQDRTKDFRHMSQIPEMANRKSFYGTVKNSWNPLSPYYPEYPCKSRHQPKIGLASQGNKIPHSQMTQAIASGKH